MRGSEEPFGGVQLMLVGDPLQLPPVVTEEQRELLQALGYKSPYLHSAKVWEHVGELKSFELTQVYRQSDPDFIVALNNIRRSHNLESALALINDTCVKSHRSDRTPTLLTPRRARAQDYNDDGLRELPGTEIVYCGKSKGKFNLQRDQLPVPEKLPLKRGAEVMAVKNDPSGRWVNGSRGRVLEMYPDEVVVRFYDTGEAFPVSPYTWKNARQVWNAELERIDEEEEGSYTQLPLVHGWALTIHKAQGLTIEDVRVDIEGGTFTSGQLYVAISRATNLEGLSLVQPLTETDVKVDQDVLRFLEWLKNLAPSPRSFDRTVY